MKIAIDISQLVFQGTGVAVYTENLVKNLLNLDKENKYILLGSSFRRSQIFHQIFQRYKRINTNINLKAYQLPPSLLSFLWNNLHKVKIEDFIGKIDLFHTSDWIEPPSKAAKVTTIHDLLVYKFPEFMHPKIVANQKRKFSWVKKESKLIIADSYSTKKDIESYLEIDSKRIKVVYLGVDEKYSPQSSVIVENIKKKLGIYGDYIFAMGNIEPRKNLSRVIKAYRNSKFNNEVQLVIVGGKEIYGSLNFDLENIVIIKNVKRTELTALYSGALCFVYPSLYEGFGLPVLEAMRCGCPVVTSDRGSLKEIASREAVIVDPEDISAISSGIKVAIEKYRTSGKKSKMIKWAKRFTWEKTAKKTLKIYKQAFAI